LKESLLEYKEVIRNIQSGTIFPVYFFFGDEDFIKDRLINEIMESVVDPQARDFNCDRFSADQIDGETLVSLALSYPMMSDKRLVIVKNIQKYSVSDKNRILSYIQAPLESTCLIMTGGKIDRRQKFYADFTKKCQWVECKPLYENQAIDWLKRLFSSKGVNISDEAAVLLVNQVGISMWALYNEAEKLLTFAWEKKELGLEEVSSAVGFYRKYNAWNLTDAVMRRDKKTAYEILKRILDEGQSPIGLIIDLTRRFILLLKIRTLLDRGVTQHEVSRSLHFKPFFTRLYMNQVKLFTLEELKIGLHILLKADHSIKTGALPPEMSMILLVHDLIQKNKKLHYYQ
jgi:DNA polymerase-3 subunit delta